MKKIKITENELIAMIEKIVNEQATGVAFGGFGENMGFSKPTDKYEELNLEGDDIEDDVAEEEVAEEEFNESEIVERLRKRMGPRKFPEKVNEQAKAKTLTKEQIDAITAIFKKKGTSLLDKIWKTIKDMHYETEDGKKVIGLLDKDKVMELLKKIF